MQYSNFVGRVGALAVALGIGTAIATPGGVAWASPETTDGSTATAGHTTGGEAPQPAPTDSPTSNPASQTPPAAAVVASAGASSSATSAEVAPGVTVSHSGGALTSTHGSASAEPEAVTDLVKAGAADLDDAGPVSPTSVKQPSGSPAASAGAQSNHSASTSRTPRTSPPSTSSTAAKTTSGQLQKPASAVAQPSTLTPQSGGAATTVASAPQAVSPSPKPSPAVAANPVQSVVSTALGKVVASALDSWLSALTSGWNESPLAWMFLAAARREVGAPTAPEVAPTAMRMAATQVVAAAVVVNQSPTAVATTSAPNVLTGAVTGKVVATDPEGAATTITLTTKPTLGTLAFNATAATFTYTPTTMQRILAATNPLAATIAMTVTVSDGVNKVPVQIAIPVAATPMTVRTDVGSVVGAGAVAATNTRAYVTNREAGTVTVIDTVTSKVMGTWAVGSAPDGVAVKQDGTALYVTSSTGSTLKVLDTATGAVKSTIAVAKPTAVTMGPTGASVYVTSYDSAKVLRINTSTNTIATTTTMPTGYRPTAIAASPDNTRLYVTTDTPTGGTAILTFGPTATTTTLVTRLSSRATTLTVSPDNGRLYVGSEDGTVSVVNTGTRTVLGVISAGGLPTAAVAVSGDGSTLVVTDAAGRVGAIDTSTGVMIAAIATRPTIDVSQRPAAALSADGTELYVTDRPAGVVHVISLTAPNAAPVAGTAVKSTPNATTGAITGAVGVIDPNGDPLTYTLSGAPSKGTVVVNANGTFTYTPTAAARHAASTVGAGPSVTTDSFVVTVSDGRRGVVTTSIGVGVSPTNKVATVTTTVGVPNTSTGVVTGSVKGVDGDNDVLTYSQLSVPTKGVVTVTATGTFTYTPTAAARHAAQRLTATAADKQDSFTVSVNDGHGGVVTSTVTVGISPTNAAPTGGKATVTQIDPKTGTVTGTLTAVDLDADRLTFTPTTPRKGTLAIGANGSFTYTPTTAARDAASATNATADTKAEAIAITVSDGYGGTSSFTLTAPVTPYPVGNHAPVIGAATVGSSSSAIGTVVGKVQATDPDGDLLTYTVTTGPTKGVVKVDAATGTYTYTPTVDARYTALVTPGVDADAFGVTVKDASGASTTTMVSVTVVPPAANAVDQRATNVAIHVPDLLFYTQPQIDTALDALQSVGVTDIRVLVPWAAVDPIQGWGDWSAVDRVVNSAAARNIKVLGVLNTTPTWAAVENTLPLAGMPRDNAQFAAFAGRAAARYKGKVTAWEVWNEPNGINAWQPAPNAAQYTALLKAAYPAIKAADPNAVVVAAAVGAVIDFGDLTVNPVRFISEMYQAGAAGYFDALSYHPYQYTTPFTQGGIHYESPLSQVNRIHDLMVANGDGHKKIWATEYGEPASVGGDDNQAAYLADFLRGWRTLSFAGPAFIHTLVDRADADPAEASFGLFRADWTPKTAVTTVKVVIAENDAIEAAARAKVL